MNILSLIKRSLLLSALLVFSGASFATDPVFTARFSDVAIRGYDTVAYFVENAPVKGSKEFESEYMGATWRFASAENKSLFDANPEKYAPQYGGYCAYAVSQGYTASIQPEQFTVHDGKLYLNYNASVNKKWLGNRDQFIVDANSNWPKILAK
jgi:YHS domain-containing protein